MSKKDRGGKGKDKGGKGSSDLQADLDAIIENEHGGEPVKGRKHTFDMSKETKKEKDKKK